jgi:septal ring factor EnvC (AmiA/AmiB activator)
VASNLPREDTTADEDLLIEAVSLLLQRQRENEAWIAQHSDLDARLAALEDRLGRLVREQATSRASAADERMARLREQLEALRSAESEARPVRAVSAVRSVPPVTTTTTTPARSAWEVLGATPRDRFGLAMMGVGVLAVLYALGTQLRLVG